MNALRSMERLFRHISKSAFRVVAFLYYFRVGKEHGYPTCCVSHFALDGARRKGRMAVRRGVIYEGTKHSYVPCGFHKRFHPDWSSWHGHTRQQLRLF